MAYLKFWGVRGSIPTPGPSTVRYGGNTPCLELRTQNDDLFILDAGSGLRELGQDLLKTGKPVKANIFISHLHWDHIQGIPFFTPAYIPGNELVFHAAKETSASLEEVLAEQMNPVNFPIQLQQMSSKFTFHELFQSTYRINGVEMETLYLNHPGMALGYKFMVNGKSIVYISDNEPYPILKDENGKQEESGEDPNQRLVNFVSGVYIFIHDAQYTPDEYQTKVQWGHSPFDYTVAVAAKADVRKLVLFHHDPLHDDDFVDKLLAEARDLAAGSNPKMEVIAAYEGLTISLD